MAHVTEQQLIEWLFELADPETLARVADHVAQCAECQAQKARLERKFAQLRVLEGDSVLSEELIRKATAPSTVSVKPHSPWWMGLAAMLMVGGLIGWMIIPDKPHEPQGRQYEPMAADRKVEAGAEKASLADESTLRKDVVVAQAMSPAMSETAAQSNAESESAPFAPASAIELVTLPRRDQVQVTIYNEEDLTLVREQRKLTLKQGWNWLQFMWANTRIDPTSLNLEALQDRDKIEIQQLVFPAGLKDVGRWLIRSEVSGEVPFELTYFTSGLSWRAFYMGTLSGNDTHLDLKTYVRVDNQSGEDFGDTQVRLVLGRIRVLDSIASLAAQQYPYGSPLPVARNENRSTMEYFQGMVRQREIDKLRRDESLLLSDRKEIFKKNLSEYVLYTIEGTEDLANRWGKRLLSLEANDIPVESLYKYDEDRWGDQAVRFVSFKNDTEHHLGQTPMPQGQIKLFARVDEGGLAFIGDTEVKYIPVNKDVELNLGPARYVKVRPKLMSFKTENHVFAADGNLTGWDEIRQWQIEVVNTRSVPIQLEIMRHFNTTAWDVSQVSETMNYEQYDVERAKFALTLAPSEHRLETYTVTTRHGRRSEEVTNNQLTN